MANAFDMKISVAGLAKVNAAIKRNPSLVLREIAILLTQSGAKIRKTIITNPWRVGGSGGGAPVDTGNLAQRSHRTVISDFQWEIYPDKNVAPYAARVHGEEPGSSPPRPWLKYALKTNEKEITKMAEAMVGRIASDLAQ